MSLGVANAPALFEELTNKILYVLRRRPLVEELIFRGAEMEAHIDDMSLGTNTQEDDVLLLPELLLWLLAATEQRARKRAIALQSGSTYEASRCQLL